jgi:predicted  nucleic acid-binding Zn-ribbon protein
MAPWKWYETSISSSMNELQQNLLKLQTLEFDEIVEPKMEKKLSELRAKIPPPILAHYDRLLAQGKKGLAAVHNQVCTGCHIRVPRAFVLALMHENDIQICENCGRYLYLPEEKEPEISCPRMAGKVCVRPRQRKELLHAV